MSLILLGRRRGGAAPSVPSTTPDWEILRDFNSGTLGTSTTGNADGFDLGGSQTVYSTEQVFEGAQAAKSTINPLQTGTFQFGGYIDSYPSNCFKGDEIWFQWYCYMPSSFLIDTDNNLLKYLRFQTLTAGGANQGYCDVYLREGAPPVSRYRLIYEGDQGAKPGTSSPWTPGGPALTFLRDQWVRNNVHIVFDDVATMDGGTARFRLWENGVLMADKTDRKTLVAADDYSDKFLGFTYWNGENAPQTQSVYIDAIRLAKNGIPSWALDLEGVA